MHLRRVGVLLISTGLVLATFPLVARGQTEEALENPPEEISLEPVPSPAPEVVTDLPPEDQSPTPGAAEPDVAAEAALPEQDPVSEAQTELSTAAEESREASQKEEGPPESVTAEETKPTNSKSSGDIVFEESEGGATYAKQKDCKCTVSYLLPYRERREAWGWTFGVGTLQFAPLNYVPDFVVNQTFDSYYGTAETPMITLSGGLQKNFSFASIGVEVGAGRYSNTASDGATLVVTPIEASLKVALDTLFREPYIVPYGSAGIFTMLYDESQASKSVKGNTRISFFYTAGLLFQLDWLDADSEMTALIENGIQNTFLYAEVKGYFASARPDPDFATNPQLGAGMKLEF